MITSRKFELPEKLKPTLRKATRLEWITLVYLVSVVMLMYPMMGSSQAMKSAWLEDMLSMVPSIAFLITTRIYDRAPTKEFPYGYHRAFTVAFLTGALALFSMGCFLLIDSALTLLKADHPTIGTIKLFGRTIWLGWLMCLVLVYSAVPPFFLGRTKLTPSRQLHNKILHTDADTQKADWMTAGTAFLGIIGIGFGWWWADSVAAIIISFSVLKDGFTDLRDAVNDLMERYPKTVDQKTDPLVSELEEWLKKQDWVRDARVRLRENGQVLMGEAFVVPLSEIDLVACIERTVKQAHEFHWKIHELSIMPVKELPEQ